MRDKHKAKVLLSSMAVLVLLGGATGAIWVTKTGEKEKPPVTTTLTPSAAKTAATTRVSYAGVTGKTALELLQTKAEVVTKDSAYGPYVDSINGSKGGTDGKYWAFYVNGKMAEIGAHAYVTNAGDTIEWKFE